jgi:vacuolar-type H+-ATPase subunit H
VSSSDRTVRRQEIEDSTQARLAEIVAAAEKAAKQVIDEAEEEARSRLIDAREEADRIVTERLAGLAELTDEIAAQAAALRRQSETLQRALAEAKAELGGGESPGGPPLTGRRAFDRDDDPEPAIDARKPSGPALTVVGGAFEGRPGAESGENGSPAGARLLATQMAVSGSSRAEIAERLRTGFAIKDTGAILDAILGPEQ